MDEGRGAGGAETEVHVTDARRLADAVLGWYAAHGRRLGIRETRDPYAVLVAEVMAQQTQIARVEPAWRGFLSRFPTVAALAAASPADVIRAWAGLGYNGRAVRLRQAALAITERYGGRVPDRVEDLTSLPGIGPYTARAVAATAFGQRVAPVDTNVRRVIGRIAAGTGSTRDPGRPLPAARVQAIADGLVPEHAALWAHALMDLGATICRPVPRCPSCPAARMCAYAARGAAGHPVTRDTTRASHAVRFASTSRWLRGRLLAHVRDAPDGAWTAVPERLGSHEADAIASACAALARDGLIEWDGAQRARLPGQRHDRVGASSAAGVRGAVAP